MDVRQQTPKSSPLANAGKLDGPQQVLEDGTQEALGVFAQAMRTAQRSAFAEVRAQLSQLARENRQLREQLGCTAASLDLSRPVSRAPNSWFGPDDPNVLDMSHVSRPASRARAWFRPEEVDVVDVPNLAKPSKPAGECAVLDHIETLTLPNALQAFTEPPQPRPQSRNAWRHAGSTVLPDVDKLASGMNVSMIACSDGRQQKRAQSVFVRESINAFRASMAKTPPPAPNNAKRRLFPDKTELMAKVQETLSKPEYNVSIYYHKDGIAQMVARHPVFETCTLAVIVLNSIWIAIDTDHNTDFSRTPPGFIIVENLFCSFFFLELLVRFLAFEHKRNCMRDGWFAFDSVLVSIAVLDTWVMVLVEAFAGVATDVTGSGSSVLRILRVVRLARTARMAHLLRAVPEVMIMFKGIVVASHAVVCTIFVMGLILYVFALAFRQLTMDGALSESHFSSVPSSMGVLLLRGTLPDFGPLLSDLSGAHLLLGTVGLGFVLLTALVVLNMLAGVLVNVVLLVADLEKEEADAIFVRNALGAILALGDADGDKTISKEEFEKLLVNPAATHLLEQVNVDVMGLVELADFIFCDSIGGLNFDDFFKLLLSLRGSNNATVKDLVDLRKFITNEICLLESAIGSVLKPALAKVHGLPNRDLL